MLGAEEILKLLPHRFPMLLVDRVLEIDTDAISIVAIKNVAHNEPFFTGHFPDMPIMPGVLIIEAMAQSARPATSLENRSGKSSAAGCCSGIVDLLRHSQVSGDHRASQLPGLRERWRDPRLYRV